MARKDDVKTRLTAEDKTGKAFKSAQEKMRNLASSAAILEGPLGKVAGRINALGAALGRMNPLAIGMSLSVASLGVAVAITSKASGELEQQMFRLGAVLKATGRDSETSAEEINEFARALGEATLTSAEQVRGAAAALATFKNIGTDQMEQVLTISQDLSAVFGGDLRTNAIKLARALDNPREGLSGLSRNILATSAAWRNMTADMFESGDVLGAHTRILGAITEKVAGAGTAEAGGLVGAADTLGERWTRLMENLGNTGPLSSVTTALRNAGSALQWFNDLLEGDEAALRLYNSAIAENLDALKAMGFSTIELTNAQTDLATSQNMLNIARERGIDLKEESVFNALIRSYKGQAASLQQLADIRDRAQAQYPADHEHVQKATQNYKRMAAILAVTTARFNVFYDVKEENATLDAILAVKASKLVDKFTKKIQDKFQKARTEMQSLVPELLAAGTAGAEKLKELEAAYIAYVNKLRADDLAKVQKRADKAVAIEEGKILRLRAMVEQERAVGFAPEAPEAGLEREAAREAAKHQILIEGLDRRRAILQDKGVEENVVYGLIQDEKILIDQAYAEKKRQLGEKSVNIQTAQMTLGAEQAASILGSMSTFLEGDSKKQFEISKKLSQAETIVSTYAGAQKAYTKFGGGPQGAAAAAVAIASGLARLATINRTKYGSTSGGGGGGGATAPVAPVLPSLEAPQKQAPQIIINNYGAITQEVFDDLVARAVENSTEVERLVIDIGNGETATVRVT